MLDARTKQTIDNACDTLVGKVPSPQTQVDIITTALIYKFMDDMDLDGLELSGKRTFFVGDLEPYAFSTVVNTKGNQERMNLYLTGLEKVQIAKSVPELFRRIFKEANIPFRDPTTFALFLKEINELKYDDSEKIGDAFEYLLNKMSTAKNAGQFRTPRNIIDFIVDVVNPTKNDTILDPACGTAGFLISAYKHITSGERLTPGELKQVTSNIVGMDIDPTMVKLSLVNLYLHQFEQPNIYEYDTLSSVARWAERYDVILANPPFMTPKGGITPHKRFAINANRSEVLFVDYFMEHLTINGRAGFVVPEGIIFQTSNAYKELRKMMLDGYLYAVISLPSGVFYPYSGVKTSVLFFDRAFAKQNDNILFVRVDNDGYSLDAKRTEIKQNDLPEALKIINEYRDGKDVSGYERAMVVSKERIAENNYDLTAAKYVERETFECKYEMVKLGDVCELQTGSRNKGGALDQGIPSIGGEQISTDGTIKNEKMKFVSEQFFDSMKKGILIPNDILLVKDGATIGKSAFYTGFFDRAAVNEHVYIIRCNENILPYYLYSIVRTTVFQEILKKYTRGIIGGLSLDIKNIEIPLPPLHVQQQIVDEIENKQSAINHAREIIKNLERERFYFAGLLDGINYNKVKLGDLLDYEQPTKYIVSSTEYDNKYKVPVLTAGQSFILGYTDETDDVFENVPVIIFDDFTTASKYVNFPFKVKSSAMKILHNHDSNVSDLKFIYTMMQNITFDSSTHKRYWISEFSDIEIPLPSIEDQKRIVAKLEAEQEIIDANKRLIDLMQDKINQVINRIYKCDM